MSLKTWKEVPIGGLILEAGNAKNYETGSWRSMRPIRDESKCVHCLTCWMFCPDSSIVVKEGKNMGFALSHCKGCGICAQECPKKCIEMKDENELRKKGA